MIIKEENRDLSTVNSDEYYLVQYMSADFAMATGVLVHINEYHNTKKALKDIYGDTIITKFPDMNCILYDNKIFNLIIKANQKQRITSEMVEKSLRSMKRILLDIDIDIKTNKIAIPKNGITELDWNIIKPIIEKVFQDTNVEILICS